MPANDSPFGYRVAASPLADPQEMAGLLSALAPRLESAGGRRGEPTTERPVVYLVLTGGSERLVLERIAQRRGGAAGQPVLLAAHRSHNSLPACLEILARVRSDGGGGEIVLLDEDDRAVEWLRRSVRIAAARIALRRSRIGRIGEPSDWLVASDHDAATVRASWGPELVSIPVDALAGRLTAGAEDEVETILSVADGCVEPDDRDLAAALAMAREIAALVSEQRLDAVTVRCFDLLREARTTACLALSLLADDGIPAGCEGDIPAVLALLWVGRLLDRRGWMANPSWVAPERGELRLAHCTAPRSLAVRHRLRSHFESGCGVAIEADLQPGPVTLLRIGGRRLERLFTVEGELSASPRETGCCRTQALVRAPPERLGELLTAPLGNHLVLVHGHHESILRHDAALRAGTRAP